MNKTPKNHGKPLTPSDNAQFRKLARENTPRRVMDLKSNAPSRRSGRRRTMSASR